MRRIKLICIIKVILLLLINKADAQQSESTLQQSGPTDNLRSAFYTGSNTDFIEEDPETISKTINGYDSTYTPNFQAFLDRVNSASTSEKNAIVDSFMAAVPSFPFVEQDTCAYFIYRGNVTSISVVLFYWVDNFPIIPLNKIPDTDFWYLYQTYEADARIEYMFIKNNAAWILDPLNPLKVHLPPELGGDHSELAMPEYLQPPEIEYYPDIPHGMLSDTVFYSTILDNSRTIKIYTPPSYDPTLNEDYPLVVIHDGLWYVDDMYADNVLDYLIEQDSIKPIIAVFLPPVSLSDRSNEYRGSQKTKFMEFILNELLPYVDDAYHTHRNPEYRAMIGVSASAHFALDFCNKYPEQFEFCGAISGGNVNYIKDSNKNIKYYLDWGTYEPTWWFQPVINLRDYLINEGYQVKWNEWHEGHTIGHYRAHLDEALIFFSSVSGEVNRVKKSTIPIQFHLGQNYPNPFNTTTTISYSIKEKAFVILKIYNVLGMEIKTLVNQLKEPNSYSIKYDSAETSSGIFFYTLQVGDNISETKKMLVLR